MTAERAPTPRRANTIQLSPCGNCEELNKEDDQDERKGGRKRREWVGEGERAGGDVFDEMVDC